VRILHIEKFHRATGGVGRYMRLLTARQRRRNDVLRFGCAGPDGPANMPEFHDFTTSRKASDLVRMIHNDAAAAKLEAYLRRHGVDVAHLHNIYHHLTPSILPVLARRRIGIVMTVHDYRLLCPTRHQRRPDGLCSRCAGNRFHHAASPRCAGVPGAALALESLIQRFWRRYFRWVDFFICPTVYMRALLRQCGAPAGKVVVVRNPIELPGASSEADRADEMFLFAGRLSREKGPALMLDLAEAMPSAEVVIAGEGPLMQMLRRQVRVRGLDNVTLPGHVCGDRMDRLFARATAVLVTSDCMENSPQTMLEAMASGACVIVPDQPPLREWVRDGITGRLFATGDADSLVRTAREVLEDPAGRKRMALAGRELAARRHRCDEIVRQVEALYEEAIRRCALRW